MTDTQFLKFISSENPFEKIESFYIKDNLKYLESSQNEYIKVSLFSILLIIMFGGMISNFQLINYPIQDVLIAFIPFTIIFTILILFTNFEIKKNEYILKEKKEMFLDNYERHFGNESFELIRLMILNNSQDPLYIMSSDHEKIDKLKRDIENLKKKKLEIEEKISKKELF